MTNIPQRRKEDKFSAKVLRFFYRFFFMIGVAAFISCIMLTLTLSRMLNYVPASLPDEMVLHYTFKSDLVEMVGKPSLSQPLLRPASTLHDVVNALDSGVKDKRVKGFVAKIEDIAFSVAQIQELRDAILRFRAAGKFAYVYSDSYGGMQSGMGDYYLASAFDKIWLQPVGVVSIGGVAAEVPFVKDLLDKVGVTAQFSHQGIYKSAPESLTETGMSVPHREMMQSIVDDLFAQMVAGMAKDRGMTVESLRALIEQGPFNEKDALRLGLIDQIGYYDEVMAEARRKPVTAEKPVPEKKEKPAEGDDKTTEKEPVPDVYETVTLLGYAFVAETISLNKGVGGFMSKLTRKEAPDYAHKGKDKIALIFGNGEIVPFASRTHAAFGETGMAADKIVQAFRAAQRDEGVAAVVFRIDSPGGSPAASETIRRVILETREKGKPVVVSMSSYAASGGYWIAAPADKIVAQPGTLTGSIGVFGGKFILAGLWEKIGLNWESVSAGSRALMWSSNSAFSPDELRKFDSLMKNIYDAFIDRVAEGRNMTHDDVRAVAEGRVFTGQQAKDTKLVDELGGLDRAVALAREVADIDANADVPVVRFPPRKSTIEMFISLATEGALFTPDIQITAEDIMKSLRADAAVQPALLKIPAHIELR